MNQYQCLTKECLEATEAVFVVIGDSRNALLIQGILKGPAVITQKESNSLETYDFYPLLITQTEILSIFDSLSRAVREGTAPDVAGKCSVADLVSFWSQAQPAEWPLQTPATDHPRIGT